MYFTASPARLAGSGRVTGAGVIGSDLPGTWAGLRGPVQDKARAVPRTGWRPPYADGPTRGQLADLITQYHARPGKSAA
jgi:hypothetical protein